jgi:lipopolysaccharide heptosyltransferase II
MIDSVIDCGTIGILGRYSLQQYLTLARQLRREHFELAFVLDRSPLLTLLPWLAGIPRRVGPDSQGRGFSLTDRVPISASPQHLQHQAEIYLDLARSINLHIDHPRMHFTPDPQDTQHVITSTQPLIAIFPGGGSNPGMQLTSKRWLLSRYRELTRQFVQELHAQVLLLGGPDDTILTHKLLDGLDLPADAVIDLAGKTNFNQLATLLQTCSLFIGNDSSPMHLAAAVNTPVIGIFGPTSPQEYGPYPPTDPHHIAIWHHPTGQPCFYLGQVRACEQCTCMQAVSVAEVFQAAKHLLSLTQEAAQ